uniref:Uncharacterized protein n=1 Tax=Arundo donax TaxID=35708 RepID=A0A0A8XNU8_ARUDO
MFSNKEEIFKHQRNFSTKLTSTKGYLKTAGTDLRENHQEQLASRRCTDFGDSMLQDPPFVKKIQIKRKVGPKIFKQNNQNFVTVYALSKAKESWSQKVQQRKCSQQIHHA